MMDELWEDEMYDDYLTDAQWMSAAHQEYARNHGELDTDRAWILSPYDVWVANPYYAGPPVPHPEEVDEAEMEAMYGPKEEHED